jgi:hypothetical protein
LATGREKASIAPDYADTAKWYAKQNSSTEIATTSTISMAKRLPFE